MFVIYTKHDCPWCDRAKAVLENFGYSYEEKHFNVDFTKEDLSQMLGDSIVPTVPQIYRIRNEGSAERIGGHEDLIKYLGILP